MRYRRFGRLGWRVSEIGYGMWGMGDWSGSEDRESFASLELALAKGVNFFDTAQAYGDGHSEQLLGMLNSRQPGKRIHNATKVPPKNRQWPSRRGVPLGQVFPRQYVDISRSNLGVDTIDLLQLHVWEDDWLATGEIQLTVSELKREGAIRAFGISINRWEPWNGVKAVKSGLVDAVQVIYNIFDQAPEDELFPACREKDVAVIARVPFDEGSLIGNLTLGSFKLTNAATAPGVDAGTTSASNTTDAFAFKLDSSLNVLWARNWGDAASQEIFAAGFDSNGDLLLTGSMVGTVDLGIGAPLVAATGADSYGSP